MSSLPSLTGKELIAALRKAGFEVQRIKGSHHFYGTLMDDPPSCRCMPETISAPAAKILRDCDLSRAQFQDILK